MSPSNPKTWTHFLSGLLVIIDKGLHEDIDPEMVEEHLLGGNLFAWLDEKCQSDTSLLREEEGDLIAAILEASGEWQPSWIREYMACENNGIVMLAAVTAVLIQNCLPSQITTSSR